MHIMKNFFVALLMLAVPAFVCAGSTLHDETVDASAAASPAWKITAMAGTHVFVDYLGGVRAGAAPEAGLRLSRWFVNKWGNRELGVGLDYSGVSGRAAGNNFSYNRLGASVMFDVMQASSSGGAEQRFGVVPYVHMAVAFAPNGVALPFGIGGYLEWRFDEHLAIQGELRGSFLSARKIRPVNGNFNVAGNASATVGISWSF